MRRQWALCYPPGPPLLIWRPSLSRHTNTVRPLRLCGWKPHHPCPPAVWSASVPARRGLAATKEGRCSHGSAGMDTPSGRGRPRSRLMTRTCQASGPFPLRPPRLCGFGESIRFPIRLFLIRHNGVVNKPFKSPRFYCVYGPEPVNSGQFSATRLNPLLCPPACYAKLSSHYAS